MDHERVLDTLADAIIVADYDDRIVHVNPAAERLLGWSSAELAGRSVKVLIPERMREEHDAGLQHFLATGQPRIIGRAVRFPALRRDGREIDIELALSILPVDNGATLIVALLRDLSDRVELERQVRISKYLSAASASGATLTKELDVHHVARTAAESLVGVFDATLAQVWVKEPPSDRLVLRASEGVIRALPFDAGAFARARTAAFMNDLREAPELEREWVEREGLRAAAAMPLIVGGELRGLLAAFFRSSLVEEATEALKIFAALTATAINGSVLHAAERAARRRFEDFVNGINHGIVWEADAETLNITFISPGAQALLGYSIEDWYAPGFLLEHIPREDRDRFVRGLRAARLGTTDVGVEHRFRKADGEPMWLHTGARLARMGPGAGTMLHALSADVTKIKVAEARTAATARQLDTILRGISEGVTAQTPDGRLLYANETAARLSGFASAAEMLTTPGDETVRRFDLFDENGRPLGPEQLPGRRALAGTAPEEAVICFRDRHGHARWSTISATPVLRASNDVEMVINVFRDVTATKQAEQNLRLLAEASVLLGTSLDYEETLRKLAGLVVPRMADWCAVHLATDGTLTEPLVVAHTDSEKSAWALELSRRYPPDPNALRGLTCVLRTGQPELYEEIPDSLLEAIAVDAEHLRVLRRVGMESAMLVPLTGRRGTFGVIAFVSGDSGRRYTKADLALAVSLAERTAVAIENARLYAESETARKQAEEARQEAEQARAQAEDASRLKDEFLTTVSHELRTPLSAILGWATMLGGDRRRDAASVQRGMEVIERNARSQLRIIEDILDVSRIVRGQLRVETEPVDLQLIIEQVLDSVRPAAEAKRLTLAFRPLDASCKLIADPERLRQVLWNLLLNAVKFTPTDGRVAVSVRQASGSLVVEVKDSGQGIDPAFLPYVFDRFRQGDATIRRSRGGLGLGLAIVRHLVEMHGGTVSAESPGLGRGATFTISLPVKPFTSAVQPAAERDRERAPDGAIEARALTGLRLLVVEDEPDSRELIEILLASEGAEVRSAASAAEALVAIDAFHPDVLVSDIGMADFDGYWLIHEIRKRQPALPAVALTAYTRREDVTRVRRAGFNEHVGKPVDPGHLVRTIASVAN